MNKKEYEQFKIYMLELALQCPGHHNSPEDIIRTANVFINWVTEGK